LVDGRALAVVSGEFELDRVAAPELERHVVVHPGGDDRADLPASAGGRAQRLQDLAVSDVVSAVAVTEGADGSTGRRVDIREVAGDGRQMAAVGRVQADGVPGRVNLDRAADA